MFKQLTALILMLALLLQVLNRVVIYVDYYNNVSSYARNCENRQLPEMHCNGRCQMVKKIREQEKKESQVPERKTYSDYLVSSRDYLSFPAYTIPGNLPEYTFTNNDRTVKMPRFIFHPPGA